MPTSKEAEIYITGGTTRAGKLALFNGAGLDFELTSFNVRSLHPGEILVKNIYTTICGSDLHTFCGLRNEPCPTVLGHEIVGEIVELHPAYNAPDLRGEPLQPGDRITWTVFASDPRSPNALRGMPQKGDALFKYGHTRVSGPEVFHGGLAEYCILKPNTGIIKLPHNMPLPVAATLNCSISTVAGALRLAGDLKEKSILITGMGHLGITCAAMCREAGATRVVAADIVAKRLETAMHFGADEISDMQQPVTDIDVVFDMSGSPVAMEFGLDSLSIGGRAVWVGAVFNNRPVQVDAERLLRRMLTIKGLHNYNYEDFVYAFHFMDRHWEQYPFLKVVEKEFALEEVQQAFQYATSEKPFRVGINLNR